MVSLIFLYVCSSLIRNKNGCQDFLTAIQLYKG
ncbi:hypothetical protein Palpr_0259 [Paludibacter propionicigenes WB4]|uniref:Uncharacterized protein n=1 Tax=Paludibacter propionicigenes (strain DSM 17365 / JCM 13257 / WB4) TaxID=694427 RepID=E4T140_PALPW|nr:hypothetical protein Palpr_0259 [Paludibacter propionicigenes WB4]